MSAVLGLGASVFCNETTSVHVRSVHLLLHVLGCFGLWSLGFGNLRESHWLHSNVLEWYWAPYNANGHQWNAVQLRGSNVSKSISVYQGYPSSKSQRFRVHEL